MNLLLYSRSLLLKTLNPALVSINRLLTDDETKKLIVKSKYNTEDIPPIPPYKGYPGNEYQKAGERIRKIKSMFKYGTSPRIQKSFIKGPPVIRLQLINPCGNRPFYRIVLIANNLESNDPFNEDLGSYDPLPNKNNEIMVAINFERIRHHMGRGIMIRDGVLQLLGLAGFLPVHPRNYLEARRNRKKQKELVEEEKKAKEEKNAKEAAKTNEEGAKAEWAKEKE